jgi:hypothetical protein
MNAQEVITIGEKRSFYSAILSEEKEIFISLPHKYNERVHKYPIIYVLEAEFLFEPAVTIAKMMAARSKMPQSIIVGLANTVYEKRHELAYKRWNGIPEKYIQFFNEELIPHIEKNYRANFHRTIIGLSPSNGFLFEAFLESPDLFEGYIALSAHLEWERVKGKILIDELLSKSKNQSYTNKSFYLGRAESDFGTYKGSEEAFTDGLNKLRKLKNSRVKYKIDIIDESEHYLMSLEGIQSGFETIYPNSIWKNPGWLGWDKTADYAQDYYKSYFDELTRIYGFDIFPVEDSHAHGFSLFGKALTAYKWGTNKQVIDLLELGINYYPKSANMHMMLAEAYKKENKLEEAIKMGRLAIQFAKMYHPNKLAAFEKMFKLLEHK